MNHQNCRQFQEWMEAEFSGELGPKAQAELQAHLKDCVECGPVWEEYQTLRRGLRVLAESAGPSTAAERRVLHAAAAKLPSASSAPRGLFRRWLFHPAAIAFATLLLVAGVGILGRQELQRRKSLEQAFPAIAPQSTSGEGQVAPAKDSFQPPLQPPPAVTKTPPPLENLEKQSAPVLAKPAPKLKKNEGPKAYPPAQGSISAPPPADGSALGDAGLAKPPAKPPPAAAEKPLPVEVQSRRLMQSPSGAATDTKASEKKSEDRDKAKERAPAAKAESYGGKPAAKSLQRESENKVNRSQTLLSTAKEKIRQKNYRGALDDLLAAQKIQDSQEIQDLILLCRSHLRGDE